MLECAYCHFVIVIVSFSACLPQTARHQRKITLEARKLRIRGLDITVRFIRRICAKNRPNSTPKIWNIRNYFVPLHRDHKREVGDP